MWLFCGHTGVIWLGARYFYSGMEDFQRTRLMDLLAPSYFILFFCCRSSFTINCQPIIVVKISQMILFDHKDFIKLTIRQ